MEKLLKFNKVKIQYYSFKLILSLLRDGKIYPNINLQQQYTYNSRFKKFISELHTANKQINRPSSVNLNLEI